MIICSVASLVTYSGNYSVVCITYSNVHHTLNKIGEFTKKLQCISMSVENNKFPDTIWRISVLPDR